MTDAHPSDVHSTDVFRAPTVPRVPVRGGGNFPVRRIYCVGRNFADHAREMGATAPASKAERGVPVFFMKPADAIATGEVVPYPGATTDLHHEVELVVAIGRDAPTGHATTALTHCGCCSADAPLTPLLDIAPARRQH